MLFASLVFDRLPLQWNQLPFALIIWLQNAGGVAAFGIAIFLLARALQRDPDDGTLLNFPPRLRFLSTVLRFAIIASGVGYILLVLQWLGAGMGIGVLRTDQAMFVRSWISLLSGVAALLVVLTPIAIDLATRIRWSRIWAIARLSWKEAIRGRVVWVFGSMALVFLFAEWFLPYKPEDQIRNYVNVVYLSMTVLFLITAGLLGSFSIPNDVKNNSIHTIVTKPVEKFEIVLGRFLGYGALLSVGLFAVSAFSLIYVERGVNEDARQESYKARVPLYGNLHFAGTKDQQKADSVGREWGYRSYITGPTKHRNEGFRQYAIWDFAEVPMSVVEQTEPVRFEYAFDIFRLSKGEEGTGVYCTFTFVDVGKFASTEPSRQAKELEARTDELRKERKKRETPINREFDQRVAKLNVEFDAKRLGQTEAVQKDLQEKYLQKFKELEEVQKLQLETLEVALIQAFHLYQKTGEVTDQHTQHFTIPAKYLKALVAESAARPRNGENPQPVLRAFVSVDLSTQSQMVGVAPQDFYLLEAEKPFWQNFLKGVLGMWFTHMLVLGVALAMSTYFSSVISLLSTLFLFLGGLCIDYLKEVADRKVDGGGPLESMARIGNRMPIAVKLEPSPTTSLILSLDGVFSWWIGFILNLVPDVSRYDLHQYVANGFDIGWLDILFLDNTLPLLGYLAPWAILAYYLMKLREIANPT